MTTGVICPEPILQFFDNAGNPAVGGTLLTQVGGVNTTTYQDVALTTPLPNPVPLNSRGEVSTAAGASSQMFLTPNTAYTFTLYDASGNQLWVATYVNGTQAIDWADIVYDRTQPEILAGITPTFPYYPPDGDIRRYGALTAATDNSAAITSALAVSAAGGAACYIPGGTWECTSEIAVTGSASMYGAGELSVLSFTGCNGLSFSPQGAYSGSRFFRDLSLIGASTTSSSWAAISIAMTSGRLSGIQFSNLTIQNWGKAVDLESTVSGVGGLWNSVFMDCWLSNNYQGYYFNGQAIQVQVVRGFADAGSDMTGSGTRYSVFTGLNGSTNDVQGLRLTGYGAYDYDVSVLLDYTTETVVDHCDLSLFTTYGVQLGTTVGGPTTIRDSWIQAKTGATNPIGIYVGDLGSPVYDRVVIDSNRLSGNAAATSVGVYCGENRYGLTITNNTIGTSALPFVYGVAGISNQAASPNLIVKFNSIYATTADIAVNTAAVNCDIGPNVNLNSGSAPLVAATSPAGMRYTAPGMRGTAAFSASTSASVSFSQVMPNATYNIALGGNAAGYAWPVNKVTTGFTIDCSASNSNVVDWQITYG